ncbi:MAG: GMC family oxidoreductase [Gemmatimonadales bacterium]|nr:MAG: GMC family oxidoreductase [Gemmatimonadales bacterium]
MTPSRLDAHASRPCRRPSCFSSRWPMILDQSTDRATSTYDVCIVGSGPAGLTLAAELADRAPELRICVLESGRRHPTDFADALRDLDWEGIPIEPQSRERVFGGASATWAGLSSPLDRIDFERRNTVRFSGWPFDRDHLLPFYAHAAERYRFPPIEMFEPERWRSAVPQGDLAPQWRQLQPTAMLAPREPFRFGPELAGVFSGCQADLRLDATVIRLEGDPATGRAEAAVVRSSSGAETRVHARAFGLACGGLENARLLLLSTYPGRRGLGNEADQVGRYLMNHPKGDFGVVVLRRRVRAEPAYFGATHGDVFGSLGLRLSESLQHGRGLLNSYLRLRPVHDWSDMPEVRLALDGLGRLKRQLVHRSRPPGARGDPASPTTSGTTLGLAWRNRREVWRHLRLHRRGGAWIHTLRIRNFMEMEPNAENRVTLGRRTDGFGTPLPEVRHAPSQRDRSTMQELHATLAAELQHQRWGQLVTGLPADTGRWPIREPASHHMGTTRMGTDPATSVVDPDGRIHGCPNVFVAGSSVFPTCGSANPTFTIVALSVRLAEHLAGTFHAGASRAGGSRRDKTAHMTSPQPPDSR